MEALAAVGLIGNILSFLQLSAQLCYKAKELEDSMHGTSKDADDLNAVTCALQNVCSDLQTGARDFPPGRGSIAALALKCARSSKEMVNALEKIRVQEPKSKWKSFRAALKTIWTASRIRDLQNKLQDFRSELTLELMIMQIEETRAMRDMGRLQFDVGSRPELLMEQIDGIKTELLSSFAHLHAELQSWKSQDSRLNLQQTMAYLKKIRPDLDETSLKQFRSDIESKAHAISMNLDAPENALFQRLISGQPDPGGPATGGSTSQISWKILGLRSSLEKLKTAAVERPDIQEQLEVIQSLQYPGSASRYHAIRDPHSQSFAYMFENHFSRWLVSEEQIFWISGKAGSGKSTLMKFLTRHSKTKESLQKWAGGRTLVISEHFFWINGSSMARSQEGLMRSILLNIFQKNPQLIRAMLNRRSNFVSSLEWTQESLSNTVLETIQMSASTHCFVVFVDGLDEYAGDHRELIGSWKKFTNMKHMKICLASRPWNVFEHAFGQVLTRKVYLEDLNEADIAAYVDGNLRSRQDYQSFTEEYEEANEIAAEIVERSKGVFLWTFLVVRSLIAGLENEDRLVDLRRRLNGFPSDLNTFFKNMLLSLDPIYQNEIGRGFSAVLSCRSDLSLANYWFMDMEDEQPGIVLNSIICGKLEMKARWRDKYAERMKKRINARFLGLLEVREDIMSTVSGHYLVDFLHRTVRDFLDTTDARQVLQSTMPTQSKTYEMLCVGTLGELAMIKVKGRYHELQKDFHFYTKRCEETQKSSLDKYASVFEEILLNCSGGQLTDIRKHPKRY